MAHLTYLGYSEDIENVLKYCCETCTRCGIGKKSKCQLRNTLLTAMTKWTVTQASLVEKSLKNGTCKWYDPKGVVGE